MTQLLHILRKDFRHQRYELGLYLLLLGGYAWSETRILLPSTSGLLMGIRGGLVPLLLSMCGLYLITRLIHSEAIPGENQFWLTRPYSWMSLLGAKITFLFLGVSLPLMAVRLIVFRVQGFPLLPGIWHLLWSQLVITAVIALPIAAVAALSSGAVQFVVFTLILIPIGSILYTDSFWLNRWPETTHWLRETLIAVALCGIAVWVLQSQYRTRKTVFTRGFASCAVVAAIVVIGYAPWSLAYAMNEWLGFSTPMTESSVPHVVLGHHTKSQSAPPSDVVLWQIPVVVQGIPAGFSAELQPVLVTLESAGKMRWQWFSPGPALTTDPEGTYWAAGAFERSYFDIARENAVTVRVMVDLALFPPAKTIHLTKEFASAPGGLQCRGIPSDDWFSRLHPLRAFEGAECRAPFAWPNLRVGFVNTEGKPMGPKTLVLQDSATYGGPLSLSSVQAQTSYFLYSEPEDVVLTVQGPPQRLHQEFEYRDVRLDEFMGLH